MQDFASKFLGRSEEAYRVIVCVSPAGSSYSSATGPTSELLVGTVDGAFALERSDSNQGWSIGRQSLRGAHISSLVYLAEHGLIFAGAYGGGLYASDDNGASWTDTMPDAPISTLAAQSRPEAPVLWAGTDAAALYRSGDAGKTWSKLPPLPAPGGRIHHLAFHPGDAHVLYATVDPGGLYRSDDDGQTWRPLRGDGARRLVIGKNAAKLYLAGTDGLFRSGDGGETWTAIAPRDRTLRELDHFFLDPRDEETFYLAQESDVLRSGDEGLTWTPLRNGLPDSANGRIEALSMHRWIRTAGLFAGTARGDIYASEERGVEWELAAAGLPPIAKLRRNGTPLAT